MFKIVAKNGAFEITDGKTTYPAASYAEMESLIWDNQLSVMFEPKDLVFDIDESDEEYRVIVFDTKIGGHDNLGSHNVSGLPAPIGEVEDMECTWAAPEELDNQQIKQLLTDAGFTYQKFP